MSAISRTVSPCRAQASRRAASAGQARDRFHRRAPSLPTWLAAAVAFAAGLVVLLSSLVAEEPERPTPEMLAALESFAVDYNALFPPTGVWLTTSYSRFWFPDQRFTETQKFSGKFQKVSRSVYEQYGTIEKETYKGRVLQSKTLHDVIQRLTVVNGDLALYAIFIDADGSRKVWGPSGVDRQGNSILFRDFTKTPTRWESSRFFLKRDGTLASTRHWNYARGEVVDTWTAQEPAPTGKSE